MNEPGALNAAAILLASVVANGFQPWGTGIAAMLFSSSQFLRFSSSQ